MKNIKIQPDRDPGEDFEDFGYFEDWDPFLSDNGNPYRVDHDLPIFKK
jgi:hypothetical protein